jgi:hypothetical protein
MLGFIGKWASSKGMGSIPDLEGLTLNEARTAITNAGFNLGNETSRGNANGANSSNHGKAKRRDDTYSLLDYESVIDFEYYSYVESPTPTPSTPTPSTPTPSTPTPSTPTPSTPTPSTPTPSTPTPATEQAWYAVGCCNGSPVYGSSVSSEATARDNVDAACVGDPTGPSNVVAQYGTTYPSINCSTPTPSTPTPVAASWYCTAAYYGANVPNETYMATSDETGYLCESYNVVCRQTPASFPSASKPTSCSSATYTIPSLVGSYNPQSTSNYNISEGATTDTSDYTKVGLVASQSPAAGTVVSISPTPTITISKYVYASTPTPSTPTPSTPTPSTPTPTLPSCTGTITNANSITCNELGLVNLGGSTVYNIASNQQCCGDALPTPTPSTPTPSTPTPSPCAANEGLPCNCSGLGYVGTRNCAGGCDCPSTPTPTTPTPTTPTPVALDCSPCDPALSGGACGTYGNGTLCWTPSGCPNRCDGDYAPTPAPSAPTPVATPTPAATPTPSAPAPCTPNCQPTGGYVCSGWAAIYQYADANGCGTCTDVTDPYGCA